MLAYFDATKDTTPTLDEMAEFEDEVFNRYNALLLEMMPPNGFDPQDIAQRSLVLTLALASGLDKPRLQVKNACACLKNALAALSPLPPGP